MHGRRGSGGVTGPVGPVLTGPLFDAKYIISAMFACGLAI